MFVSILAMPHPEETRNWLDKWKTPAVDLFELNVSCPMPSSTVGMHIGKAPSSPTSN